ncbi:Protein ESMERALDA 1 [Linum perenne]
MHASKRIPNSGHNSPSSPQSPLRSPRYRGRSKPGRFPSAAALPPGGGRNLAHRLAWLLLSVLLRRQGIFLFAPLMYISGMLLYMGTVSFDVVPQISRRPAPGSVYKSPLVYEKLRPEMDADNSSADALLTIWKNSYKSGEWKPCMKKYQEGIQASNGYIYVEANGGLNQQRTSICDAVAIAGLLNATLVTPNFHYHSIWKDPSKFKDIYDEDFFITALQNDVRVVDKIPGYLMERFDHNFTNVFNFRVKAWSPIEFYKDVVLPRLLEEKVVRISPFAHRLSFDAPSAVQRLRCIANYEALRFSKPISTLGENLVARMKGLSSSQGGKYVSVHLRFEEDMVAFSCCVFDGGAKEDRDMRAARERGWRGKFTKPGRTILPGAIRLNGKCPLSPLEVGLMLRGMGFGKNTYIYLASGKIYNAEKYMAPLLQMFPNLQTKDTLATEEELTPFKNFSSRMAAIDYTVCLHSEVFVTTQGGNFPHFLLGHRRFLYGGHAKTIRPDKRKLALLFDNTSLGWKSFKRQMLSMRSHSDSKGFELKRTNDSVFSHPCPDCMCQMNKAETSKLS